MKWRLWVDELKAFHLYNLVATLKTQDQITKDIGINNKLLKYFTKRITVKSEYLSYP